VNCIILGRAEAYASKRPVLHAIVNGAGVGVGFMLGLLLLGSVREILGAGTLFGVSLFGPDFQPWVVMLLPPGGFFVLGTWLLIFSWLRERPAKPSAAREQAHGH
jgi:electron transport complex protein RnfE